MWKFWQVFASDCEDVIGASRFFSVMPWCKLFLFRCKKSSRNRLSQTWSSLVCTSNFNSMALILYICNNAQTAFLSHFNTPVVTLSRMKKTTVNGWKTLSQRRWQMSRGWWWQREVFLWRHLTTIGHFGSFGREVTSNLSGNVKLVYQFSVNMISFNSNLM